LNHFLNKVSTQFDYINAEIDSTRKVCFRLSVTFQPFEDVAGDIIMCIDMALILLLISLRKLSFSIEHEKFGWISKKSMEIIQEMKASIRAYKNYYNNYQHKFHF